MLLAAITEEENSRVNVAAANAAQQIALKSNGKRDPDQPRYKLLNPSGKGLWQPPDQTAVVSADLKLDAERRAVGSVGHGRRESVFKDD
jgi:hypothetical protein